MDVLVTSTAAGAALIIALGGSVCLAGNQPWSVTPCTEEAVARGLIYQMMPYPVPFPYGYLGWGCGFADLDGDGDEDVIIIGRSDGVVGLFENTGTGSFIDRTVGSGITALPQGSAFAVADYNADGLPDIYFTQLAAGNRLMRGVEAFKFQNATASAGVGDTGAAKGCAWVDFNLDGWLDLHVCNYDGIVPNTAGKPDRLYRNNGNGTFTDVAAAQGVASPGYGFQAAWTDIDNDGDRDMYLSQDRGHLPPLFQSNRLFRNDGGTLVEISAGSGANLPFFSMGLACGDIDQNGFTDFYCTNIGTPSGPVAGKNPLLLNQGNNTFVESSVAWGVQALITSWGTFFFDFDNNGWDDIYFNAQFLANKLYLNDGTPPMTDVTTMAGVQGSVGPNIQSFCSAYADIDHDGDLDLLLNNLGGNVQLFVNHEGTERNWIQYRVDGLWPNRDAIGAWTRVRTGTKWQLREVYAGTNGYLGQNQRRPHIGLGEATQVDELIVRWPGGSPTRTLTNLPANASWTIYPPSRLGDFDGNGTVDLIDFAALLTCHGGPLLGGFEMMDFNGNSVVDGVDADAFVAVYEGTIEDCNGNGVVDLLDILENPSLDGDGNGELDVCLPSPDLNGDGTVDGGDLGTLLSQWGGPGSADLNGDGTVDGEDLGMLLASWGRAGLR